MLRNTLLAVSAFGVLSACATAPKLDVSWPGGMEASTARFEKDLRTLSGDDYEGREAGTPGYAKAADYVENTFKELGLKPMGDNGTYRQQVPLRRAYALADQSSVTLGDAKLTVYNDYIPAPARTVEELMAAGEVVYMGYGIDAPQFGLTAFEDIDVEGKVIAVIAGAPEGLPSEESAHFQSWGTKRRTAARNGAAGMIALVDTSGTEQSQAQIAQQLSQPTDMVIHPKDTYPRMDAVVTMRSPGVEKLAAAAGVSAEALLSGEMEARSLGVTASLSTKTRFEDYKAPNVIGMIEGSDPDLKDEYVVLTAHLDHIGKLRVIEEDPEQDIINNGAMDNASGTATMLEEARKFIYDKERPRRSILFISLTAEEKGLLGSEYFAQHPTVPQDAMVANVNLDMPILLHDFTDVIAFGAEHSTLKALTEAAGDSMGVSVMPDPVPNFVLFVRSDHYNFVKIGVPSVFLFTGFGNGGEEKFWEFFRTNYHQPGDEADQGIIYASGAKFAEINYRIAKEIANSDERPKWNEGDFFGDTFGKKTGM